ncbi:MAG: glycosyltransferase family 2 protein [Nitrospinae bacterium]|nr:glycosyltransferase family 2 protein [Nitrospinota bacterium]
MKTKLHSIVVPVYESQESLKNLVARVSAAMEKAGINFELILVDDGSKDDSFQKIKRLAKEHTFIRGFKLSRNFGQQASTLSGLQQCRGDYIAIIDDDLQDPPEVLPDFFHNIYGENDVVYGIRRERKEGLIKRTMYAAFYRIFDKVSRVSIPFDSGDFCAMKRKVLDAMLELYDAYPFLRGNRSWVGFKQKGIEYKRDERAEGESGYTFARYFKLALSAIFSFSHIPIRLATFSGFTVAFLSIIWVCYVFLKWLWIGIDVPGYTSIIFMVSFLGGLQLLFLGLIGEYIVRLYEQSRRWPNSIIAENTEEPE